MWGIGGGSGGSPAPPPASSSSGRSGSSSKGGSGSSSSSSSSRGGSSRGKAAGPPPTAATEATCEFAPVSWFERSGLLYLLSGLGALLIGAKCYDSFFQCDYVQHPNHSEWSTPAGYTVPQFVALVIGTYLLPFGLMLVLVYAVQSYKSPFWAYTPIKVFVYAALAALAAYATHLSYLMGKEIIDCGVFCIGHDASSNATNDAAIVSTGIIYFIVSLLLAALFSALALLSIFSSPQDNVASNRTERGSSSANNGTSLVYENEPLIPPDPARAKEMSFKQKSTQFRRNRARSAQTVLALALTFGALYPIFFLACTVLPTWWAYFTKHSIQTYEASRPPEAYGTYWRLAVGGDLVLKLYPDILIYYGAIYLVAGVALAAQFVPRLANRLASKPSVLAGMTVGEFVLSNLLVVLLVGQFCYWFYDHGWENEEIDSRTGAERAARSIGQVANMVTGLLVLPVTRNSVWSALFGVSWESLLVYHQLLGYLLLVLVLLHMFLWWRVFAQQGTFPHDIFAVPLKYHKDNFTVPLAMVSTLLMFAVMGGLSLPVVRRLHYDLFYWTHHLSLGLFAMMLWHSTMSWYYVAVGLTLWAADHAIRLYRSVGISVRVESATIEGNGNVVHLAYSVATPCSLLQGGNPFAKTPYGPLSHAAGQYVFVNIPLVSQLAWHPFTISSAPGEPCTHHHIKALGSGADQWTERLLLVVRGLALDAQAQAHAHAQDRDRERERDKDRNRSTAAALSIEALLRGATKRRLTINIDGPYGIPLDPSPYRCVLLVAGGIGITPLYATYKHFYAASQGADRSVRPPRPSSPPPCLLPLFSSCRIFLVSQLR